MIISEADAALLAGLFIVLSVMAAIGILVTFFFWRSIGRFVPDPWSKLAVEAIQIVSGATSIAAAFAVAGQKGVWFRPLVAGSVCLGAFKLLQVLLDNRVKAADTKSRAEAAEYKRQAEDYLRLLGVLLECVRRKVERVTRVIQERLGATPTVTHARDALTPRPHLDEILNGVAAYFCGWLPPEESRVAAFRVGVYVGQGGVMVPVNGVHSRQRGYKPFSSFRAHRKHFELTSEEPAHVVQAVRKKGMLVVEHCETAAAKGDFNFFSADQPAYLRSMVSFYLGEVCGENAMMVPAALVIDTDVAGFFKEAEWNSLRYCLGEFGPRVKLELLLLALVDKRGFGDESSVDPGPVGSEAVGQG